MSLFGHARRLTLLPLVFGLLIPAGAASAEATVTAVSVEWGTSGSYSQVLGDELPWLGINRFQITLSQPASLSAGDVSVTGVSTGNYGPVTVSGSGTNYTITLAEPIESADEIILTLGNAQIATDTDYFYVLPGDVNGDGIVNALDLIDVRISMVGTYNVFDDINGDGVVDITDYGLVKVRVGDGLP